MAKRKRKKIVHTIQGCKCGANHIKNSTDLGFGLSFQSGEHTLYIEKETK